MKKFEKTIILAALLAAAVIPVSAQEATAPFPARGNWSLEAGMGVNSVLNDRRIGGYGLAAEVRLSKWLSPEAGIRIGFGGIKDSPQEGDRLWLTGREPFNLLAVQGDLFWDPGATFAGYDEARRWRILPYARFEYLVVSDGAKAGIRDQEFAAGGGLRAMYDLGNRVSVYADASCVAAREMAYRDTGHYLGFPSLTAGLAVRIGGRGFLRKGRCGKDVGQDPTGTPPAGDNSLAMPLAGEDSEVKQ